MDGGRVMVTGVMNHEHRVLSPSRRASALTNRPAQVVGNRKVRAASRERMTGLDGAVRIMEAIP